MTPTTPEASASSSAADNLAETAAIAVAPGSRTWPQSVPFYYGWVNVVIAAISMTATLPSRTHGLGLITEPLTRDVGISQTYFTSINFVSTVLGAAFSLPVGYLIDRYGVRSVLTVVSLLFGVVVLGMAAVTTPLALLITLTLIRGFGQSALSIVSTAIIGKWFGRRMGLAMGVYAVLLSIGFIGGIVSVEHVKEVYGWRTAWNGCGLFLLLGLAPMGWLLVRSTPESCGVANDEHSAGASPVSAQDQAISDYTHREALATPIFWIIAVGTSMFNFVWSSITLLNESVLGEQGFAGNVAGNSLALLVPGGLVANMVCGALTRRGNVAKVLGIGMLMLCVSLALFPQVNTQERLRLYMLVMGVIGGIVTVAHFVAFRALFGASHLGRIQGPAQLLSVLFSAAGPLFAAYIHQTTGSYRAGFYIMSLTVGVLGIAAFLVSTPTSRQTAVAIDDRS